MYVRQPDLEWKYLSDEDPAAPWPPQRDGRERRAVDRPRLRLDHAVLFVVALAVMLTASAVLVHTRNQALQGVAGVEQGVQAAVEVEQWLQEHTPELHTELLADDLASRYVTIMVEDERHLLAVYAQDRSPHAVLHIHDTWFAGRSAAAEVTVTLPVPQVGLATDRTAEGAIVFRQTRFYRETPHGWLRTRPDPALWGPSRNLETDHLIWRYQQRDEVAVLAVADELDTLYAQWRRDHALDKARTEKLVVHVRVDSLPTRVTAQERAGTEVTVASPAVYLAPPAFADDEILAQAVALVLLESLWAELVEQGDGPPTRGLLFGLHLWQGGDADMPLPGGSRALLGPYMGAAASENDSTVALSSGSLNELCTAFGVWMVQPAVIQVPVYCGPAGSSSLFYAPLLDPPQIPRGIGPLFYGEQLNFAGCPTVIWGESSVLETVIDYAVTTYGRESVPALVVAAGEHDSWERLVPAVYGVPFEEFEAGWRQHLAELAE